MLNSLRNAAGSWAVKALLVLLVASFAVWGISGRLVEGFNSNSVVTAGETTVDVVEFRLAYDRQLRVLSQRMGQQITREQAQAAGVDSQVMAQLVAGAVLDEQAREMRLGLSRDRLAVLTTEDPAFRGPDGRFDRRTFDAVLRNVGMRPQDYLKNREQVAVRQQIVEAVSDGVAIPDTFLKALALYRGEDRTVEFVKVPVSSVEPIEAPSDEVLKAYFEENKAAYAAPEYRKIAYFVLDPEAIADPSVITEERVRKDYEGNKARFTTPETRKVQQIVYRSDEAARGALDRLRAGATFDELAEAEGRSAADTDLGTVQKADIPDPAIADAAFALGLNEVSGIVNGAFGAVILRVTEINPEIVRPLEEAAADIRRELALVEANSVLLDVHDTYEDTRAGGATMAEAAAKLKIRMEVIEAVDRTGQTPDGTILKDIPESAELLRGAFEATPGAENPAINIGRSGFLWYEVLDVIAARDRSLDEVRARVIEDWRKHEAEDRLVTKAAELEKRVADGATLDDIAAELGLEKQIKRGAKRGADDADLGSAGVNAAFGVMQGKTGLVPGPSGQSQIIFKVTEVFEPAGASAQAIPEQERTALTNAFSDDLLDQLVGKLQKQYGVTMDRAALQRALSF